MIKFWKCCAWSLSLSLMATSLMGAEPGKTTNARSANRQVTRIAASDSDDELFDTRLISRRLEPTAEQTPPPAPAAAPLPGCSDRMYSGCAQTPYDSSATQNPNAPWNNPNAPSSSTMPNDSFGSLSAGQGILTAQADTPAFLGDFFGGPAMFGSSTGGFDPVFGPGDTLSGSGSGDVLIGNLSGNAGVLKLAEGTSPLPRDRVFFSYNYFNNVALIPGGTGVNRITPGMEKTFFDGNASVEVRVPMAWTLNSTIPINSQTGAINYGTNDFELGNVTFFSKFILARSEHLVLTGGSGICIPTADDTKIVDPARGNRTRLAIKNDAVHLMPFVGAIYTPTEAWFTQGLIQIDVATRGREVVIDGNHAGRLNDSTFLFASIGTGYWLHRDTNSNSYLTGLAPIFELHLNQGLQNLDSLTYTADNSGTTMLGSPTAGKVQTLNAVIGVTSQIQNNKTLTVGYGVPIGGGSDTVFDGELRVLFNWYFGGSLNRMSRVQF